MAKKPNAKLAALGVTLPLFPMTNCGSLPKPLELTELRYRVSRGIHQNSELDRKEKLSTEIWVRQQERFGIDVISDGEMDRGDMVQHMAMKLAGFEEGGTVRCWGNRYYRKPIVKSKVEWTGPIVQENWRYAQRITHSVVKAVLTGPYTLMSWSFDEHYGSREQLCRDLSIALNKEMKILVENGAKIIQVDELAFPGRLTELGLVEECVAELTRGVNAYVILRVSSQDLAGVWPRLQKWPVDQFYLDMVNADFDALPLLKKTKTAKDLAFGVVSSHEPAAEPVALIARRIKKILPLIPLEKIWFGTDAGLKTCSIEEATAKLKNLSAAVRAVRLQHR
jgi:5-methyltetrahydropteroyltriglutamate--homocysteine methyltransferase